ncbi:MAG: anthranilate synthase component I family protein, partial [Leptospira sp.]|nr:anthranilate synthase component I family protein [Leptospira sp.]
KRIERIFSGEPGKTEDPGNSDPVPEKIGILKNGDPAASGFRSSLGMEDYKNAFDRIKESINNGIVYQTCLTVSFWKDYSDDALSDYLNLRKINPVPFGAFLETPLFRILSFSPERFFSLRNDRIEARPMKGTRIRIDNQQEEIELIESLTHSEKDNAENSMIVDLIRNDIGRVSELGTVKVEKIHQIESYKTVFQLTSILSGKLRKNLDISHLLSAIFPGGSMTGVPKISALNLINELEKSPRGIYSGCFGYMDIRGGADFSIVIRTAISYDNKIKLQSGGGIVFDSILEEEWNELIGKSAFLLNYFGNKKEF